MGMPIYTPSKDCRFVIRFSIDLTTPTRFFVFSRFVKVGDDTKFLKHIYFSAVDQTLIESLYQLGICDPSSAVEDVSIESRYLQAHYNLPKDTLFSCIQLTKYGNEAASFFVKRDHTTNMIHWEIRIHVYK